MISFHFHLNKQGNSNTDRLTDQRTSPQNIGPTNEPTNGPAQTASDLKWFQAWNWFLDDFDSFSTKIHQETVRYEQTNGPTDKPTNQQTNQRTNQWTNCRSLRSKVIWNISSDSLMILTHFRPKSTWKQCVTDKPTDQRTNELINRRASGHILLWRGEDASLKLAYVAWKKFDMNECKCWGSLFGQLYSLI